MALAVLPPAPPEETLETVSPVDELELFALELFALELAEVVELMVALSPEVALALLFRLEVVLLELL